MYVHLCIFWTKNYILYTNVPCTCMNTYSHMYVSTYIYVCDNSSYMKVNATL